MNFFKLIFFIAFVSHSVYSFAQTKFDLDYTVLNFPIRTEPCGDYLQFQYELNEALQIIDSIILRKKYSIEKDLMYKVGDVVFPIHSYVPELNLGFYWINEETVSKEAICYWVHSYDCTAIEPNLQFDPEIIDRFNNYYGEGLFNDEIYDIANEIRNLKEQEEKEILYSSFLESWIINGAYPEFQIYDGRFDYIKEIENDTLKVNELQKALEYQNIARIKNFLWSKSDSLKSLAESIIIKRSINPEEASKLLEWYNNETLSLDEIAYVTEINKNTNLPKMIFFQATNPMFLWERQTNNPKVKILTDKKYFKGQALRFKLEKKSRKDRKQFFIKHVNDHLKVRNR